MKIYLDFDGTVVTHQYPEIGVPVPGCFEVLRKLQNAGHEIILNSYRANKKGKELKNALNFLNSNINEGIEPITKVAGKKMDPGTWNLDSTKRNNCLFIDDYCFGIPLKEAEVNKYIVDWTALDKVFAEQDFYTVVVKEDAEVVDAAEEAVQENPRGKGLFNRLFKNLPAGMNMKMNMNTL